VGGPPKKKRHHYVPQFVLRNFSPGGDAVPTFVLGSGEFHERSSVRGQCARDYFYGRSGEMEDAFAQSETKVSAVLRRAAVGDLVGFDAPYRVRAFPDTAGHAVLEEHPLHVLREFIYYQTHRTAASADETQEVIDRAAKRWLRKDPRLKKEAPEAFEHLDNVIIKLNDPMRNILYTTGPFKFGMLDMTVKFLVVDEPSFILSDHPVALRNQYSEVNPGGPGALGMLARGLQMIMPVSPTMTVAVYDGDVYECGAEDSVIVKVSARNARVLNEMQLRNAAECVYLHPSVPQDHAELQRTWLNRPRRTQRRVEGPIKDRGDGTFSQFEYTLPAEVAPPPRVRCFRINDRTSETVCRSFGDMQSFPLRSFALSEAVEDMRAVLDWKVKEQILRERRPVSPAWKGWFDSIEDPRSPGGRFHGR
jgi:hypothetical protein